MNVWEKHAERLRRQAEFKRFDSWCVEHPVQSWFFAIGGAALIFEVSEFLRLGLEAFARWLVS